MLTDLLENAIKFSPAGSLIEIGVAEERGGYEIEILDRAGTLAPEERMRVFDRFYRTPSARDAAATGSGLGLAIVQWAVRLHGGDVRVDPRTPTGNRFVVRLPSPMPPGTARGAEERRGGDLGDRFPSGRQPRDFSYPSARGAVAQLDRARVS